LIYVIAHISVLFVYVAGLARLFQSSAGDVVPLAVGMWCYVVIYLGLGSALGRAGRAVSGEFRPAHARVLTVMGLGAGSILALTLQLLPSVRFSPVRNAALSVTDPFTTLVALGNEDPQSILILVILVITALVSILINLRAMLIGVIDVSKAYVPLAPAVPREAAE
jgi:hypothetical protein